MPYKIKKFKEMTDKNYPKRGKYGPKPKIKRVRPEDIPKNGSKYGKKPKVKRVRKRI